MFGATFPQAYRGDWSCRRSNLPLPAWTWVAVSA